ncbi:GTPase-activating protein Bem3p [[Candida] jaroonii]|uniref:GTPase-activating protein Bem3p n=1 Tax=[Candida] jaroonii TaxID=467808 RepID=A0ACA9YCH9_9ASCO|nr:GTPase-activating protein Bem3p [[Candida] jaroonii]
MIEDITPSHPNFDRSGLTDIQFIEQLMFEIRELKSTIERKDLLIKSLQGNLNVDHSISHKKSWDRLSDKKAESNSEERSLKEKEAKDLKEKKEREAKELLLKEKQAKEARAREAKEKEAKEKEEKEKEAKEKEVKEKQAREKEAQEKEARERELREKEALELKEREARDQEAKENEIKAQETRSKIQPQEEIPEELQVVPQRSSRRKKLEDNQDKEANKLNKIEESSHQTIPGREESEESVSNRSSVYSDEKMDTQDNTNTTIEVSINSTLDDTDIENESKSVLTTLKTNETLMMHKNPSNSSFQSYKSRIKLPVHLQSQQDFHDNTSTVSSHASEAKSIEALSRNNSHHNDSVLSPQTSRQNLSPQSSRVNNHPSSSEAFKRASSPTPSNIQTPPLPSDPPKIPLPVSPDDAKSILSPKGLTHSRTLKDLNINNLTLPGNNYPSNNSNSTINTSNNNLNTLRSPAVVHQDYDIPIPQTPEGFYNKDINESISNISSPAQTNYSQSPAHFNQGFYDDSIRTPITNDFSQDSFKREPSNYSGSHSNLNPSSYSQNQPNQPYSNNNRSNMSFNDDESLFIKPEDFQTITINIISTISVGNIQHQMKKLDDVYITISVNDRQSGKEMWRIRKSYPQLVAFDNEIRPVVEYFGLPVLPDKSLFFSTTPNKIDLRKNGLQNYFNTLFVMPHIPHLILFRICKYLSLDFVNPLDDFKSGSRKEGYLVRKYKGLGTNWKVRWCQVDGPMLEIYDFPGGNLVESINLVNCQIGRQSNDTIAEDKGYRHAFLIMETVKSKLSSSMPKHFFCAESDEERDDWVEILIDSTNNDTSSNASIVEDSKSFNGSVDKNLDKSFASNESKYDEEMLKSPGDDRKVSKKRSIFPFRKNNNSNNNIASNQIFDATNIVDSELNNTITSPQHSEEIQHYLDKMGLDDTSTKSIFGRELSKVYEISHHEFLGKQIPSIIYRCVEFLLRTGAIFEEGIFRLSGSASMIRQLKDSYNKNFDIDLFACELKPDIHTVAGLFKTYLRELPQPIITEKLMNELRHIIMNRGGNSNNSATALILKEYIKRLDKIHYDTTFIIIKFLKEIINNCNVNKMNLRNVCIVFVPTLNISLDILSLLLIDFHCIFENQDPVPDNQREIIELNIPNF